MFYAFAVRSAARHDPAIAAVRLRVGSLKEGWTSMKRPVVFLLLGPSLVALAVWMVAAAIAGRIDDSFIGVCAITAFLLTLPVSSIAGLLAGILPGGLRRFLGPSLPGPLGWR